MTGNRKGLAADSFNEIATIRIELRDTDPLIWREMDVPTSVTLSAANGMDHPKIVAEFQASMKFWPR